MNSTDVLYIPLDKAKNLAAEINCTVHAGSSEAMRLNNMIMNAEHAGRDSIPLSDWFGNSLIDLYNFFNEVGMLE